MIAPAPAPVADPRLAELFRGEPNPMEKLSARQDMALMVTVPGIAHSLTKDGRLAALECGHFVMTKSLHRASCPRCGEMIRSGWDYDGFRNLGAPDTFSWPGDPLRILHEKMEATLEPRFSPIGP